MPMMGPTTRTPAPPLLPRETPRLLLRRFRREDLPTLLAYRNDPEVARYQGWDDAGDPSLRRFVEHMAKAPALRPGNWFQIALETRCDGHHVGDLGIYPDDIGNVTLGYSLAREAQGKGLASEAVTALLDALFHEQVVHRVVATTDVRNEASIRLLERLGFRREGHRLDSYLWHGRWASEYAYALLRREWTGRTGA